MLECTTLEVVIFCVDMYSVCKLLKYTWQNVKFVPEPNRVSYFSFFPVLHIHMHKILQMNILLLLWLHLGPVALHVSSPPPHRLQFKAKADNVKKLNQVLLALTALISPGCGTC